MTREQIDAIQRIVDADPDGLLQAEMLVSEARDSASPLHTLFDWDDAAMAHRARVDRARGIIRNVRTIIVRGELTYRDVVYVKEPRAAWRQPGYATVQNLATDPDATQAALDAELARVQAAIARAIRVARELNSEGRFVEMLVAAIDDYNREAPTRLDMAAD